MLLKLVSQTFLYIFKVLYNFSKILLRSVFKCHDILHHKNCKVLPSSFKIFLKPQKYFLSPFPFKRGFTFLKNSTRKTHHSKAQQPSPTQRLNCLVGRKYPKITFMQIIIKIYAQSCVYRRTQTERNANY